MKLKGRRTGIGFAVGTALVLLCIYYSRDQPENFASILAVFVGVYGVFVGKNFMQAKHIEEPKKEIIKDVD